MQKWPSAKSSEFGGQGSDRMSRLARLRCLQYTSFAGKLSCKAVSWKGGKRCKVTSAHWTAVQQEKLFHCHGPWGRTPSTILLPPQTFLGLKPLWVCQFQCWPLSQTWLLRKMPRWLPKRSKLPPHQPPQFWIKVQAWWSNIWFHSFIFLLVPASMVGFLQFLLYNCFLHHGHEIQINDPCYQVHTHHLCVSQERTLVGALQNF